MCVCDCRRSIMWPKQENLRGKLPVRQIFPHQAGLIDVNHLHVVWSSALLHEWFQTSVELDPRVTPHAWGECEPQRWQIGAGLTLTAWLFSSLSAPLPFRACQHRLCPSLTQSCPGSVGKIRGKGSRFTPVCCQGNQPTDVRLKQWNAGKVSASLSFCACVVGTQIHHQDTPIRTSESSDSLQCNKR